MKYLKICVITKNISGLKIEDGKVKIGMIDFAQKQLHDIVYVELPSVGDTITQG